MIINDSTVHDIDVARWMFDDEIAAVTVLTPRRSPRPASGFNDPLLVLLEIAGGALVDVEASVNAGFGYDIRGEVVGEDGTVELSESAGAVVIAGRPAHRPGAGRLAGRFARAFDTEFQAWIDAVRAGDTTGPSSWDGYAATRGLRGRRRGAAHPGPVPVVLREQPDLYLKG